MSVSAIITCYIIGSTLCTRLFCNLPLFVHKHIPFVFADLIYYRHTYVFVLLQALDIWSVIHFTLTLRRLTGACARPRNLAQYVLYE